MGLSVLVGYSFWGLIFALRVQMSVSPDEEDLCTDRKTDSDHGDAHVNGGHRIVQSHSEFHVRQRTAKASRPFVQPWSWKSSLGSASWRLTWCHQTKLFILTQRLRISGGAVAG
jgi:hypothetical protein